MGQVDVLWLSPTTLGKPSGLPWCGLSRNTDSACHGGVFHQPLNWKMRLLGAFGVLEHDKASLSALPLSSGPPVHLFWQKQQFPALGVGAGKLNKNICKNPRGSF